MVKGMRAERKQHGEARMAELDEAYLSRDLAQAWRSARVMTRKPFGPKRRRMDAAMATRPFLAQWGPFLAAAGPQGGCRAELLADTPPFPLLHTECPSESCIRDARADLGKFIRYMRRGKGRKMPSDYDAPMEVWRLILEGPSNPTKKGVGFTLSETPPVHSGMLHLLFSITRSTRHVLVQFHRSRAWCIPKHNMKEGCKAVRLTHGLPVMSKAFYKAVHKSSMHDTPAHSKFGCVPGRRREEAVAIQQTTGARLSMAGISQFDCFHDVANAFPPLAFEGVESTYSQSDFISEAVGQHYRGAVFTSDIRGSDHVVQPFSGVFPGGSIAIGMFARQYREPVRMWTQAVALEGTTLGTQSVVTGEDISLSVTSFVDGVAAKLAASSSEELIHRSAQFTAFLDTQLGTIWVEQNVDKRVHSGIFHGTGARQSVREQYSASESGGTSRDAGYLGPWLRYDGSFVGERARRVAAARRAWRAFSIFFTSGAILRLRVLVFKCVVVLVLFSGVLSVALSCADEAVFDHSLLPGGGPSSRARPARERRGRERPSTRLCRIARS